MIFIFSERRRAGNLPLQQQFDQQVSSGEDWDI